MDEGISDIHVIDPQPVIMSTVMHLPVTSEAVCQGHVHHTLSTTPVITPLVTGPDSLIRCHQHRM